LLSFCYTAEFRGPGVHDRFNQNSYHDDDDDDLDMDPRARIFGQRGGRVILLGDGTEISIGHLMDGRNDDDDEMHDEDHARRIEEMEDSDEWEEEDGDDEQVQKSAPSATTGAAAAPQGIEGAPLTRQGDESGNLSSATAPPPVASLETERQTKKELDSTEDKQASRPAVAETLKEAETAAENK
jgi:hypothetical protein